MKSTYYSVISFVMLMTTPFIASHAVEFVVLSVGLLFAIAGVVVSNKEGLSNDTTTNDVPKL